LADALQEHGIGRDDGVACYLYNCPEYFEAFEVPWVGWSRLAGFHAAVVG
jgi:hypothetical protein